MRGHATCTRARMRLTATSCASYPCDCMPRHQPPGPCKVRHQSATLRLIAHATRVGKCELGCSTPFATTLSVCFHETIRMESSHLNTPLSFISPPMWTRCHFPTFPAFNV
ncbi:hypothetical protein HanHA300_Chr01g0031681 [Helianthus annuus]|nr:hypothetical protein HanHA300_Chr01g0031681 [Helianthus annuus]KAJ0628214.1 hypothetical protein HanHA89_Chr01g0034231 [Helianthus annuus]KAJ0784502.1 hypothetical protein HanLR1_Chr01g0032731 [Helianthus annuus]